MWFYIKICQNQQFAFLVMCDVWYGRLKLYTVDYSWQLWTQTIRELVGLYRVICGPLKVICGTVLALYRVMCGPVKVMCSTVMPINLWCAVMCGFQALRPNSNPQPCLLKFCMLYVFIFCILFLPSIVLGGVCRSTSAALRIHRLGPT